jgi:hypothetical protein
MTPDDIAALAKLLACKTSLGATCSNMEIRAALEFLKGRGYLVRPQQNNGDASKCFVCANDGQKETLT